MYAVSMSNAYINLRLSLISDLINLKQKLKVHIGCTCKRTETVKIERTKEPHTQNK